MPSRYIDSRHRAKPWKAKVKMEGLTYQLGHFATYEEADEAEEEFRSEHGLKRNSRRAKDRSSC